MRVCVCAVWNSCEMVGMESSDLGVGEYVGEVCVGVCICIFLEI